MKLALFVMGFVLLTALFIGCSGTNEQPGPSGDTALDAEVEQSMSNDLATPNDSVEIGEMI